MENKDKQKVSSKSSPWIECESKSRPGKKYLFNTETGERKWSKPVQPPEKPNKTLSSPANDRLKRLQRDLQKTKSLTKKSDEKTITTNNKTAKVQPPSRKTIATEALPLVSPRERLKNLQCTAIKDQLKNAALLPTNAKATLPVPEIRKKFPETVELSKQSTKKRTATQSKAVDEGVSVNKIQKSQKPISKELINAVKTSIPKPTSNIENTKRVLERTVKKRLLQHQETQTPQKLEANVPELKFLTETPKNVCTTVKQLNNSANKRLERFRESLQNEKNAQNQSFLLTANSLNNINFEYEAMDWEPTEEQNTSWSIFGSPSVPNNNNIYEDMDVDENLLLIEAEKIQEIANLKEKWRKNFTYIIIDTNVFIGHLSFIEKLKNTKIIGVPGIVIYIPYSVLQELDKLKRRESIKADVVRAIRFLNKLFEEKNELVQAQSALEERNLLINPGSVDDSILNCCLQVKIHIPKVILLSEDTNLRTKAISNDIEVATNLDLLNKLL